MHKKENHAHQEHFWGGDFILNKPQGDCSTTLIVLSNTWTSLRSNDGFGIEMIKAFIIVENTNLVKGV